MKRKQLESLLSALIPTLRHFIERQIGTASTKLSASLDQRIDALPKPKDGNDGKSVTLEDITPLVLTTIAEQIPKAAEIATVLLETVELPPVPTTEEVAAVVLRSTPTGDQIAAIVLSKLAVPTAQEVAELVRVPVPVVPTAKEIAAEVPAPVVPTVDEIVAAVLAKLTIPTAQEVAALVPVPAVSAVPTAEEIAKLVTAPVVPTLDEIVASVMSKLTIPTAKEIAAEVQVPAPEIPAVPTVDQIIELLTPQLPNEKSIIEEVRADVLRSMPTPDEIAERVVLPTLPSADELADRVRSMITLPTAKEIAAEVVMPAVPTAEEIAKLVPIPEIPDFPDLPELPTTKEIVDELRQFIPAPVKGDRGDDGESVDMTAIEQTIERHIEGRVARWALEWERRASDQLQKFLATIEKPKDGVDGLGFDDMQVDYDGERHFTIRLERADKPTKSFAFDLPIVIYRGVWKAGEDYERGDSVTWDGCTWIAKNGTTEKPGQSDSWQLSVKKGRDGRDNDDPKKGGGGAAARVRVAPRRTGED